MNDIRSFGLKVLRRARSRISRLRPVEQAALVEVFTRKELLGWIRVPENHDCREVTLYVNETPVATAVTAGAVAHRTPFPAHQFRLRLHSLWDFCDVGDVLSVRANGKFMHIAGFGVTRGAPRTGARKLSELRELLSAGYLFNQKGHLQLSKVIDEDWQRAAFALYDRARVLLESECGLHLMVVYGTLLGAVRKGEFIGRDHDFDVGYFSKERTPESAKAEAVRVMLTLAGAGFHVHPTPSCFYVSDPKSDGVQINFGRLFFDETGHLQSAFGFAGTAEYVRESHTGYQEIRLQGHRVLTVNNPAELLACIYGDGWRTPNPGFFWHKDRKRQTPEARFVGAELEELRERVKAREEAFSATSESTVFVST